MAAVRFGWKISCAAGKCRRATCAKLRVGCNFRSPPGRRNFRIRILGVCFRLDHILTTFSSYSLHPFRHLFPPPLSAMANFRGFFVCRSPTLFRCVRPTVNANCASGVARLGCSRFACLPRILRRSCRVAGLGGFRSRPGPGASPLKADDGSAGESAFPDSSGCRKTVRRWADRLPLRRRSGTSHLSVEIKSNCGTQFFLHSRAPFFLEPRNR